MHRVLTVGAVPVAVGVAHGEDAGRDRRLLDPMPSPAVRYGGRLVDTAG